MATIPAPPRLDTGSAGSTIVTGAITAPYVPKLYYNSALLNGQLRRYGEAMRLMKIYLQAAPTAPDRRTAEDEIYKWELLLEQIKKS